MILQTTSLAKTIGSKNLFNDVSFSIDDGEKVALIGRNGQGKTTLLRMIAGEDKDYEGSIELQKNIRITLTRQEHIAHTDQKAIEYILDSVPNYTKYGKILHEFEHSVHTDLHAYTEAQEYFSDQGYYYITDLILGTLKQFQITDEQAQSPLSTLSGGEKRFIELVRLMYSKSTLFLIDEPTNHMDYIGKEQFITWMNETDTAMLIVTHDRDVLKHVDTIIELKDKKMYVFHGNFDHYISLNTTNTTTSVKQYESQLNRLEEAKKRVEWGNRMRAKSKAWKIKYDHWLREYEAIKAATVKPSFWIDQESTENLDKHVSESYEKFKEKNIRVSIQPDKHRISQLLKVHGLTLGYQGTPLFTDMSFLLRNNEHLFIKGRNGAGKSTLVNTVMSLSKSETPNASIMEGTITLGTAVRIGEYKQEIDHKYLPLTLEEAVISVYQECNLPIDDQKIKSTLSQYLFDPRVDAKQKIRDLSGGQKARFQIIKMLAANPNLLILDEPTNHLDLPSIEELEQALLSFQGGIIYISHDSYFIDHLGGETIEI
jgi:ATPase subunit of ABC transporter with duplicated ATPase domains